MPFKDTKYKETVDIENLALLQTRVVFMCLTRLVKWKQLIDMV